MKRPTRRSFLITTALTTGGIVGSSFLHQTATHSDSSSHSTSSPATSSDTTPPQPLPERILGKTNLSLPILGLGGAGQTPLSWAGAERDAIALIERALQLGIRYFDTAASYGPSEDYLGKVLPAHRANIVLASKTSVRDRDGAWRELERSLKRLNTDYLDIWQLHHVSFQAELDTLFGANGAVRALEEARAQKLIRWTGITGHHEPSVIAEALRRYSFDTTLVALNAADPHHPRPFAPTVLPVARDRNVGVLAMKVPAYGRLFSSGALSGMHEAMGYSLSLPGVHGCIIAAETIAQLEQNVHAAQAFQPLSETAMQAIVQRTAVTWQENSFFRAWT